MDNAEPRRPAPASPEWTLWLVDQLHLDAHQEAVLTSALASLLARTAPGQELCGRLLSEAARAAQAGAAAAELDDVVVEISASLRTYQARPWGGECAMVGVRRRKSR